jgi:prepilin-type N-terminal cleavage/methylation domain-containing protein
VKRAFSLTELMIALVIIGILAAIILPHFQSSSIQAKEAAAKDHLRLLRGTIEFYAAQNKGVPPGYPDNDIGSDPDSDSFYEQIVDSGNYYKKMPKNPFNNLDTINMIGNSETFPADATGIYGWVYQPATMTIKLDWPGSDENGIRYYDY